MWNFPGFLLQRYAFVPQGASLQLAQQLCTQQPISQPACCIVWPCCTCCCGYRDGAVESAGLLPLDPCTHHLGQYLIMMTCCRRICAAGCAAAPEPHSPGASGGLEDPAGAFWFRYPDLCFMDAWHVLTAAWDVGVYRLSLYFRVEGFWVHTSGYRAAHPSVSQRQGGLLHLIKQLLLQHEACQYLHTSRLQALHRWCLQVVPHVQNCCTHPLKRQPLQPLKFDHLLGRRC